MKYKRGRIIKKIFEFMHNLGVISVVSQYENKEVRYNCQVENCHHRPNVLDVSIKRPLNNGENPIYYFKEQHDNM